MPKRYFLGVDPGKSGAFAVLSDSQELMSIYDMPCRDRQPCPYGIGTLYMGMNKKYHKPFSVIEKPHFRPTDGKKGISTYFLGAGFLMMPILWDWKIVMIPPTVWTRSLHVGQPGDLSAKKKSLAAFQALFPKLGRSKAFLDGKMIYDGRIDAVLIAEYARRIFMESPIDRESSIKKSSNDSQYQGLNPPITGGENGSRTKTTTGLPEGSKGKEFAGRK